MVQVVFPREEDIVDKLGSMQNAYDLVLMCEIVAKKHGGVLTSIREIENAFHAAIAYVSGDNYRLIALLNNLVTPCIERLMCDDADRQSLIDSWEDPQKWP